jgi:hypothetical protein
VTPLVGGVGLSSQPIWAGGSVDGGLEAVVSWGEDPGGLATDVGGAVPVAMGLDAETEGLLVPHQDSPSRVRSCADGTHA